MDMEKNLENLKKDLKHAEVVYYKILGAVEALEAIDKGESDPPKEPKK